MDTKDYVLVEMSCVDYVLMKKYVATCVERVQKSRERNRKLRGSKKETVDNQNNIPFFYIQKATKNPSPGYLEEYQNHLSSQELTEDSE